MALNATTPPVEYRMVEIHPMRLVLGYVNPRDIGWRHRTYEEITPESQADYDRLVVSIFHHGIQDPPIVWRNPGTQERHVLVGMRRVEIARRMRIQHVRCAEIMEDIREWRAVDVERGTQLRDFLGRARY